LGRKIKSNQLAINRCIGEFFLTYKIRAGETSDPAACFLPTQPGPPLGRVTVGIGHPIGNHRSGTWLDKNQRLAVGSAQELTNITR